MRVSFQRTEEVKEKCRKSKSLSRNWNSASRRALPVNLATKVNLETRVTVHWHKDWADQGCQLCHVRHLPGLHSAIGVTRANPVISQQDWNSDHSPGELETCIRTASSRAPPVSVSFTA